MRDKRITLKEKSETLRKQAERALTDQTADLQEELSTKDVQSLVHELRTHQIELEMQNEELRRAQVELEESRNRYSDLYDFAPIGYFTFDNNGLIIDVNLTGANKLDVERSFLIKKPFSLYIVPDSKDVFYSHLRQVFKTGGRQTCELKLVDKNRIQFDAQLESLLVQDSEGNFSRCRTAISDITERKRAEEALSLLASIVESSDDAIIGKTLDGTILSWNSGAQKIYGYTADEVKGSSISILAPSDHPDEVSQLMERVRRGQYIEHYETVHIRNDGKQIDVSLTISPIKDSTGRIIGASTIACDVTERKWMEEVLRRAHDELEIRVQERTAELLEANKEIQEQASLLDKARDAIAVRDVENRLIYWNKGAQRLYGWTAEEVIGKNADELLYKEESSLLIEAKNSVIEKDEWIGELYQVMKDGKEIIVESRWSLIRDNEGKPKSILIINTDITEKKKLESQLFRSQRMESIGTLAGGIAHDLNNMLTPMMLSVEMLKQKFKDEQSQKLLTILEKNSQRSADLIKQVLSFARGVEGEHKPLQIMNLISEIKKVIKETFPKSIEIRTDIQKDLFAISGDSTQLHQVIMNLCVNARDAMPDGGILNITASNFCIDENYARMHTEAKVGSYITIAVSDNGIGIPPEILDRIFEPFFTTKEFGKGTGLGLSTVLAIVKSHGGFIDVYSEVRKGTKFSIYLPAIQTEMQIEEEEQLELLVGHGELVLVAEDEDSIRDITILTLEKNGYSALAAEDGADAVGEYAQNMDKIKVILMDMMMPIMDGQASIQAIRKINRDVKIIAVSGLAEKDRRAKIADYANAFLPKPYTAEKLLKTIHDVLSAK
ncbi:two-component system, cell cycle sensor histidine kinase and response regulator CckA [Methanosarcinales archaeon]|nr:two-component system, cell cycle sensor histidine kinase and response regulator CckA [Methanosarcinales archaeon]